VARRGRAQNAALRAGQSVHGGVIDVTGRKLADVKPAKKRRAAAAGIGGKQEGVWDCGNRNLECLLSVALSGMLWVMSPRTFTRSLLGGAGFTRMTFERVV